MSRTAVVAAIACLLAQPAFASAQSSGQDLADAQYVRDNWRTLWQPAWLEIVLVTIAIVLYATRASQIRGRLPRWRALCFLAGCGVLIFAASSPIDPIGEHGLFSVHMVQHLLIGDIAGLLLVLGVTGPILQPALKFKFVQRLRVLTHPMVACALWAAIIVGWHIPVMYEASLNHTAIHALEHVSFLTAGILMWAPILETLPAPEWFGTGAKLGFVVGIRVVDSIVANAFWWAGTPFYSSYVDTAPLWGMSALEDQGYAGTLMMAWTGTVTLVVASVLFFRMAREGEMRQELIERGVDPVAVRRAVRYGRGELLAARHGVVLGDTPPPAGPAV